MTRQIDGFAVRNAYRHYACLYTLGHEQRAAQRQMMIAFGHWLLQLTMSMLY